MALFAGSNQSFEIFQRSFRIFHDFGGKKLWIGKAVKIGQGFVIEPDNIKTGLVPL